MQIACRAWSCHGWLGSFSGRAWAGMSAAKPCYSPMLAGSTLYREKAERNKKKHCFHTTFDSPMELFPRLCVVGFQLTRSARRRQADTAPCCDEPEYHAAWIILRQAKGSTLTPMLGLQCGEFFLHAHGLCRGGIGFSGGCCWCLRCVLRVGRRC